jgi:hypothetical protein
MRISYYLVLAVAAFLAASTVYARSPVAVVNYDNILIVTGSGKPPTAEQVTKAIVDGAGAGARKWFVEKSADGKLRATYNVRSHSIVVSIVPNADKYSIQYADSVNMKYQVLNGAPVIHPFYNNWVRELKTSIDFELRKL